MSYRLPLLPFWLSRNSNLPRRALLHRPPRPCPAPAPVRHQSTQTPCNESDKAFDSLVEPPKSSSPKPPSSAVPTASSPPSSQIVFGSRLAGPAERPSFEVVNGRVPPRPEEPDNCCMSGCVNCVWDRYREELEAWAAAKTVAARQARDGDGGKAERPKRARVVAPAAPATSGSMDDDGGGSEGLWGSAAAGDDGETAEGLLSGLPVGIKEFVRTEKRLQERKKKRRRSVQTEADEDVT